MKRRPSAPRASYETVNQYRGQHDELDVEQIDPNNLRARRVRVLRPNRLRKYLSTRSITQAMCDAGELLAAQWERAGIRESVTTRYGASGGASSKLTLPHRDVTADGIDAHKALQRALAGDRRRYADLLVSVCCYDEGLRDTRRLRRALLALAKHYGFLSPQSQVGDGLP